MLIFAPKAIPIYVFSVIIGIGGSLIWVGQGTILIVNSTAENIGRNTGIFYFMFESSLGTAWINAALIDIDCVSEIIHENLFSGSKKWLEIPSFTTSSMGKST